MYSTDQLLATETFIKFFDFPHLPLYVALNALKKKFILYSRAVSDVIVAYEMRSTFAKPN